MPDLTDLTAAVKALAREQGAHLARPGPVLDPGRQARIVRSPLHLRAQPEVPEAPCLPGGLPRVSEPVDGGVLVLAGGLQEHLEEARALLEAEIYGDPENFHNYVASVTDAETAIAELTEALH